MKVLKFGGTSVGSAERIRSIANLLPNNEPCVVVLSAMAGTTNSLVEITNDAISCKMLMAIEKAKNLEDKYISTTENLYSSKTYRNRGEKFVTEIFQQIIRRFIDGFSLRDSLEIIAFGEILSAGLFHMYLTELGKKSAYISALQFMRTDKDKEPDYYYIEESIDRVITANPFAQVYITEGFICRNSKGEVDNLGRGGSDYTAAIVGNAVNATEVQIWTDIDGLHNNDPRFVEKTLPLRSLSYNEAAELAYFGAKILHPATIQPCRVKNIPVLLKNTLQPNDEGTLITAFHNPQGIKAIAAKDGITAINIRSSRMLLAFGYLNKVFEVFNQNKTAVDMITTSEVAISLTIDNTENLSSILKEVSEFSSVEVEHNQTIICIVGDFVAKRNGYAALVFEALKEIPIRMISYGGSNNNISVLIDSQNKIAALRALQKIVNSNPEFNKVIPSPKTAEIRETPFYQYDIDLLKQTLDVAKKESDKYGYNIHYALKANSNASLLKIISEFGFGADCVSGNEIKTALENGFDPQKIVFAGVGKTDEEIEFAIENKIFCLHCESIQELEVINRIAAKKDERVNIALRINPNINANTHKNITTGTHSNKFGLTLNEAKEAVGIIPGLLNIELIGLHFHIGSQILDMNIFKQLAIKTIEIQNELNFNEPFEYLNLGGGLGIDYNNPNDYPIPNFKEYFLNINSALKSKQNIHFELGRSLVGQCGRLVTKVLYTKKTDEKSFVIVDAGMNTLIRPALYGAHHQIENVTSKDIKQENYSLVGPICESTDCFDENVTLPITQRGDLIEILSCGAYGEVMSSKYNLRDLPGIKFTQSL